MKKLGLTLLILLAVAGYGWADTQVIGVGLPSTGGTVTGSVVVTGDVSANTLHVSGASTLAGVTSSGDVSANTMHTQNLIGSSAIAIKPASNSTTAIQLQDASGTAIMALDSTNKKITISGKTNSLQFDSAGTFAHYLRFTNTGGDATFGIESSAGGQNEVGGLAYASTLTSVGATALQFGTNATARVTILPTTGYTGILTTNPTVALDVSGNIRGGRNTTTHSGTENVTAVSMMGDAHVVTGAYTVSLPTAAVGYSATFMATTAAVMNLQLQTATDVIYLNGTALAANHKIASDGTIRAKVYVECVATGFYEVTAINGVWVDNGTP